MRYQLTDQKKNSTIILLSPGQAPRCHKIGLGFTEKPTVKIVH